MKTSASGRFDEIDVLRGAASLCVVGSHYTSHCVRYFGEAPFHIGLEYGFYAVKLFFIISGFVIYFTLDKSRTMLDFAFSRFARLYPAYVVALTLMMLVETKVFGGQMWWGGYLANATMLQEFLGYDNLDNVFWSLTVEIAFYFQMAVLLGMGLMSRIEPVALAWIAVACAWWGARNLFGIQLPELLVRLYLLEYVPFFMAGIAFYLIGKSGRTPQRLAILVAALLTEGLIHGAQAFFVAVVLFVLFAAATAGWLRFAVSRVTLWLGAVSYSLYISHRNIGYSVLDFLHERGVPTSMALALTFCGALLLAAGLHYAVERPAGRLLRNWYRLRLRPA